MLAHWREADEPAAFFYAFARRPRAFGPQHGRVVIHFTIEHAHARGLGLAFTVDVAVLELMRARVVRSAIDFPKLRAWFAAHVVAIPRKPWAPTAVAWRDPTRRPRQDPTHAHHRSPTPLHLVALGLLVIAACAPTKRSFKMPSGSMIPALAPDSGFVVDASIKAPARGEVWALHSPEHPEQEFVKRVVGLVGDRVEMRGGALVLDGNPVPSCVVGAFASKDDNAAHPGHLVLEKLGAQVFLIFIEDLETPGASGPWVTLPGELFVMGDNPERAIGARGAQFCLLVRERQ